MHDFLIGKLNVDYDKETVAKIIDGLKYKKKTSFRVNHIKSDISSIEKELQSQDIPYEKSKRYDDSFIIDTEYKSKIESLPIYKEGKIYIQSISSMMPVYALEPKEGENILDMCAAPGSKTTLIQSITHNKVNLTAVELHKDRFERLKYNLSLQGAGAFTMNISALDLDDALKFDKILIDAPCSGSGILDLSSEAYEKYFTEVLIAKCVKTQRKLIDKASKILKKGGTMVYSTCSLLKVENEDMLAYAEKRGFKAENHEKILPDEIYEGFFVAKFIRL